MLVETFDDAEERRYGNYFERIYQLKEKGKSIDQIARKYKQIPRDFIERVFARLTPVKLHLKEEDVFRRKSEPNDESEEKRTGLTAHQRTVRTLGTEGGRMRAESSIVGLGVAGGWRKFRFGRPVGEAA